MAQLYALYDTYWYKYADQRALGYPLMDSPVPLILIIGGYWYLIKKSPHWMANKPAFDITISIQIYNLFQIIMCAIGSVHGLILLLQGDLKCIVHLGNSPNDQWFVFYSWLYSFGKLIDLFDTLFFVLRRKFNLITTLHTYHHTLMATSSILYTRYFPGGELSVMAMINCLVHAVMYSYYAYCLYSGNKGNIWWKKHITQLQLAQFCMILLFYTYKLVFVSECPFPKCLLVFTIMQAVVMLYLFGNYYYNAFVKTKDSKPDSENYNGWNVK